MRNIIPDGKHTLSGVCEINVACGFDGEDIVDGLCLTIDGKNYIAYSDPDDGYRSYGCFHEDDKYEQKNKFPGQEVMVSNEDWDECDADQYEHTGNAVRIYNIDTHELIFECGTINDDSYYPVGFWHYSPEYLPINKQKKQEDDNKRFEDALNTMYDVFGIARPVEDKKVEDTEECRVPEQSEPDVDYECLDFEPGCDDDVDDGYAEFCDACKVLEDFKIDATFWQTLEHLVRSNVKRNFGNWLENEFELYNTDELLSFWEEFAKIVKPNG